MSEFAIPADIKKKLDLVQEKQARKKHEEAQKAAEVKKEDELFPEIEVTEDDLLKFWDSMLKREAFVEEFDVRGTTIKLQTRSTSEMNEMFERIDKATFNLVATKERMHVDMMLACSLLEFGDDKVGALSFDERLSYIRSLPAPLSKFLVSLLDNFDCKVMKMTEMLKKENF